MKVWVVCTCIPERGAEPCQPYVFRTEAEAEDFATKMMIGEWEAVGAWDEPPDGPGEFGPTPFPGDWREAQERIQSFYDDGSWGPWEITVHEV